MVTNQFPPFFLSSPCLYLIHVLNDLSDTVTDLHDTSPRQTDQKEGLSEACRLKFEMMENAEQDPFCLGKVNIVVTLCTAEVIRFANDDGSVRSSLRSLPYPRLSLCFLVSYRPCHSNHYLDELDCLICWVDKYLQLSPLYGSLSRFENVNVQADISGDLIKVHSIPNLALAAAAAAEDHADDIGSVVSM
ncbi:hypothetical protein BC829DRAFT_393336, partial [Chytridium lagenaria]